MSIKFLIILIIWTSDDLQKIRKRDKKVFEKIFNEYKDKIYNYLLIKTKGNEMLTEDLISDTFYHALKDAPKLFNTKNLLGWLITIAFRRFNDFLRKEYRENKYNDILLNEEKVKQDSNPAEDERIYMINVAMDNLNKDYADIIKMKYIDDMSIKKISAEMQKSEKSIESSLFRAKQALKKEINKISDKMKM